MTRSKGLSPATSRPFNPIGLSVAWETERRDNLRSRDGRAHSNDTLDTEHNISSGGEAPKTENETTMR